MRKDISKWVKTCISCQRAKVQRHNSTIPEHISIPAARFRQVHLDIVGPLPPSKGYRYCLTAIDRYTRWPEAVPIADISANTIVTTFYATWIARFGAPAVITTDRGSQFESSLFQALIQLIGATRTRTTAYHPASNGMVERFHRSLKTAIRCHVDAEWTDILPTVLLGLRASLKEDIKTSAAELTYGTPIRLPDEFFVDSDTTTDPQIFVEHLRQHMRRVRPCPTSHHNKPKAFILKDLYSCTHVFIRVDAVRKPFDLPYEGPYEVRERISDKVFKICVQGEEITVSANRLKPAYLEVIPTLNTSEENVPTSPSLRTYPPKKVKFAT